MDMVGTESAMLVKGGHPVRHARTSLVIGETVEGSLWLIRAVSWKSGKEPLLYLVGPKGEHTWAPYSDLETGTRL